MIRTMMATLAAAVVISGASFAAPAKKAAKPAPKMTEVKYCPVTEQKVQGAGSGSRVVGNYKVFFCCAGCDTEWDTWTTQKKLQVAKKLAAKQAAAQKKAAPKG